MKNNFEVFYNDLKNCNNKFFNGKNKFIWKTNIVGENYGKSFNSRKKPKQERFNDIEDEILRHILFYENNFLKTIDGHLILLKQENPIIIFDKIPYELHD